MRCGWRCGRRSRKVTILSSLGQKEGWAGNVMASKRPARKWAIQGFCALDERPATEVQNFWLKIRALHQRKRFFAEAASKISLVHQWTQGLRRATPNPILFTCAECGHQMEVGMHGGPLRARFCDHCDSPFSFTNNELAVNMNTSSLRLPGHRQYQTSGRFRKESASLEALAMPMAKI
jgi:hypothetical protein